MPRVIACGALVLMTAAPTARNVPEAGVPRTLAEERSARIQALRYELEVRIPAAVSEPVRGRATVRFHLTDASRPLAFDFADSARLQSVRGRAGQIAAEMVNGHVVLPPSALQTDNEVTFEFLAGDGPLNRDPEFLYTIFVPARAHEAFPCFDQPDLKARYSLTLEIPEGWEALSNGELLERQADGGRMRMRFAETKPIPTYLFAFAAGRFSVETADRGKRRFRMFHRETDAAKVARNRDAIFDLHAAALDWLEQYTGIPYPFGKFEFLLVPAFQFGGMEHPGAILYNAPALLLDPSATQNQKLGRASLIAHETAHMWFGDLVTMTWFDDVWMKEVFANFMAAKIVNPSFPEINHDLRFLYSHYPGAYDVDRTAGTNAIRQPLDNLKEAGSLYGAIIYQKAPIVMRQLEMMVGADGLRDGLREYLEAHSYRNASWPDLIRLLDARSPEDLAAWSRVWVEEEGRPVVATTEVGARPAGVYLQFAQTDPKPQRGLKWPQRMRVTAGYRDAAWWNPNGILTVNVPLNGPDAKAWIGHAPPPLYVLPTGEGVAYGEFILDEGSRAYLTAHLADVPDALTRGAALVTLWEEMLGGRIPASMMMDAIVVALTREGDELNVQRMLAYLQEAFWKFIPADERTRRAADIEQLLRRGLDEAKSPSLKSAWFNALRDMALTPGTLTWLERVWSNREVVPGLTLAEPDYITLALELAVREVPAWEQMLDRQAARIENPDRKARFEFVRPALSADAAVRDAFFASLHEAGNRRREAWVLEGVSYLHHPLRAAASEKLIPAALALLGEIQRTGDIFFPKRWTDATLNGHRSASAARMVRSFLLDLPSGYPERLRRIVRSSADDLFRASR